MAQSGQLHQGFLVVADISGYTKFLTTTELDHAQSIIGELTALLRSCLAPPLRFVKLEGDAVLCCGDRSALEEGERLLEVVEVSYLEFCNRRDAMAAATTCTCAACAAIDGLDLKFVAHYGQYLAQVAGDAPDIAGPDVIVVHRLLKNSITERTGCRAYAFFTDACLGRLPAALDLPAHAQEYESLGEVRGGVYNLAPVLEGLRHAPARYVSPEAADFQFSFDVPAPPSVVWQYNVEPSKRLLWQGDLKAETRQPNEAGRAGVGATGHCDHGSWAIEHRYVDWRPFRYFTTVDTPTRRSLSSPPEMTTTIELSATADGGTNTTMRFRFHDRGRRNRIQLRFFAPLLRRQFARDARRLSELLGAREAGGGRPSD